MDLASSSNRASFYLGEDKMDPIKMACQGLNDACLAEMSDDGDENRMIRLGICAMAKKSRSAPMKEILERLERFEYIKTIVFEENVILNEPVENWPICDCLISFYSKGFCLDKAIRYERLRKPYVLNDLPMQYQLQDRRAVYAILMEHEIDHPRYAVSDQCDTDVNHAEVIEFDDQIEVNGVVFQKPFVEKPVSAEDHNVYIYFPTSAGGGSQRLFRKIGSRSSVYSPVSRIRKAGSYIYEEFMPTDGTDVKVYTLGPDYAHAEARKSPALDGKVERDKNGKEVRYPVILTAKEKMMARMLCLAFKQTICGFDLLRANGRSYVCDVNGFSFVKNSMKYYDDCAKIIGNMIMRRIAPQLSIPLSISYQPEDIPIVPTTYGTMMELRSVIAIIRHGDRTPKQKMKMEVKHQKFFDLFAKYHGYDNSHLKLKRPKQLQEVLDIARSLLDELNTRPDPEVEEKKSKLEQLKSVLEMYGHFSGINRKVQLKYQPHGRPKKSSSDEDFPSEPSLVLVLKWGGELTPAGKIQAEELGKAFRCMYPGGEGDYGQPGLGLLRLHSTFRHDLKIYASDEGRVQMTAAAFAKGLLALEGELTPILVQMVKSANTNGLLDNEPQSLSDYQNIVKSRLRDIFHEDRDFTPDDYTTLAPTGSRALINAMNFIKNPYRLCCRVYELIKDLTERIRTLKSDPTSRETKLYHGETWELMMRRWAKLEKDFRQKNCQFDISKIPDIYDCIKYDLQHNQDLLKFECGNELHTLSKALADIVVPQEYGITEKEKIQIAQSICTPLLSKIKCDLERNIDEDSTRLDTRYSKGVSTPHRHVRTRLYFTSESHILSLLTLIRHGGLCNIQTDKQWCRAMDYVSAISELNYMTQIVVMMYEDPTKDPSSEQRFHLELHFSPGAQMYETDKNYPTGIGYRPQQKSNPGTPPELIEEGETQKHVRIVSPVQSFRASQTERARRAKNVDEGPLEDVSSSSETLKSHSAENISSDEECEEEEEEDNSNTTCAATKRRSTSPISIGKSTSKSRHKSAENLARAAACGTTSEPGRSQSFEEKSSNYQERPRHILEGFKHDASCFHLARHFIRILVQHVDPVWKAPSPESHDIGSLRKVIQQALLEGHHTRLSDLLYLPGLMASHSHSFATIFSHIYGEAKGSETHVPPIRPLETLHNSLTLKQVDDFIDTLLLNVSDAGDKKSRHDTSEHLRRIPLTAASSLSSSNSSSGGPPSPASSTSEDIAHKLRLLMDDGTRPESQADLSDSSVVMTSPVLVSSITSSSDFVQSTLSMDMDSASSSSTDDKRIESTPTCPID